MRLQGTARAVSVFSWKASCSQETFCSRTLSEERIFLEGNMEELLSSIKDKLMKLPESTRVLPGHGPETTLGMEKAFNGYLR